MSVCIMNQLTIYQPNNMDQAKVFLISEYPFYASLLKRCIFTWNTKIPTARVGLDKQGNIKLEVSPTFFNSLKAKPRAGLLMHEVLHLAMQHLTRGGDLADKKIANIAMDIAINQYIPPDMLPDGCLLHEQFKFPKGRAFEFYYAELMKDKQAQESKGGKGKADGKETLDDHSQFGETGEPGDEGDRCELPKDIQREIIKQAVQEAADEAEGLAPGNTPKVILEELETIAKQKSKINWRQRLRQFIGRTRLRETESTRNRPNRRMGFQAPGTKYLDGPKIMLACDQSGSVDNVMCNRLLQEFAHILDAVKEKTEIVYFDTQIAKTETLDKMRTIPKRYASGGTNFQCVVDYAKTKAVDVLIIATDAEAPAPTGARFPICWCVIGNSNADHLPGVKIKIED